MAQREYRQVSHTGKEWSGHYLLDARKWGSGAYILTYNNRLTEIVKAFQRWTVENDLEDNDIIYARIFELGWGYKNPRHLADLKILRDSGKVVIFSSPPGSKAAPGRTGLIPFGKLKSHIAHARRRN